VHAAAEHEAWLGYLRSAALAIVTLTVTEAGYARGADGGLDVTRDDIQADVAVLREEPGSPVRTPLGRLVAGLLARRDAQVGPITVVPCDNLPENGAVASRVVGDLADLVDPTLRDWIDDRVSWITTMVDRITPRTTPADRETVRSATGVADAAPVVTEPFSEWVLSGDFVAGSPGWEEVGARLVADIAPFEERKLWLLNGGHSLLAYAGSMRGHETVAEAVTDPTCRGWLEQWWTEASRHLSLPEEEVSVYRAALLERFANPGIRHLLAQIAADGSQKLPVRILPTLRQQLDSGVVPTGGARVLAAWMCHLRGRGAPIADPAAAELVGLASGPLPDAVRQVLSFLDRRLGQDERVVDAVLGHVPELCP
jgi:fructuronate reductase